MFSKTLKQNTWIKKISLGFVCLAIVFSSVFFGQVKRVSAEETSSVFQQTSNAIGSMLSTATQLKKEYSLITSSALNNDDTELYESATATRVKIDEALAAVERYQAEAASARDAAFEAERSGNLAEVATQQQILKNIATRATNRTAELATENSNIQESFSTSPALEAANSAAKEESTNFCSIFSGAFDFNLCVKAFVASMATIQLQFAALITKLSGELFETSIDFSLNKLNQIVKCQGANGAPLTICPFKATWVSLRDIANLFFIFILLYAAIKTILGMDSGKVVRNVILVALFINFSFFFTSLMVDASNTLTVAIYNQAVTTSLPKLANGTSASIGDAVTGAMGLPGIFDGKKFFEIQSVDQTMGAIIMTSFGGSILLIVAAFVFLAGAILFIMRSLWLFVLLLASPLAFLAMAIPGKDYSGSWWKKLNENLLFPPAFMVMIFISLQIMNAVTSSNQNLAATIAKAFQEGGSVAIQPILNFVIVIGLMGMSIFISKYLGATGAKTLNDWGKKAAGNVAFGGSAAVGRATIGRAANAVSESGTLKDLATREGFTGAFSRLGLRASRGVAGSSFDTRATGLIDKKLGLGSAGGKGGYTKSVEDKAKRAADFAKSLGPTEADTESVEFRKRELEAEKNRIINEPKEALEQAKKDMAEHQKKIGQLTIRSNQANIPNEERDRAQRQLEKLNSQTQDKQNKINSAQSKVDDISREDSWQQRRALKIDEKIKGAESKLDELKGVDKKEAEKRVKKMAGFKFTEKDRKKWTPEEISRFENKVKEIQQEKLASVRANKLADSLEDTQNLLGFIANRKLFSLKPKAVRLAEAAAIRKQAKGKDAKTQLKEIAKKLDEEEGGETEKETEEESPKEEAENKSE